MIGEIFWHRQLAGTWPRCSVGGCSAGTTVTAASGKLTQLPRPWWWLAGHVSGTYVAVVVVVGLAARGRQAAWSTAVRAWRHRRSCGESSDARDWASRSARSNARDHDDLVLVEVDVWGDLYGDLYGDVYGDLYVYDTSPRGRRPAWTPAGRRSRVCGGGRLTRG